MKLILTRKVADLGRPGDVVDVKDGYGRNYLVPQGVAIKWTRGAESQIARIKRAREVREINDSAHAHEVKDRLEALTVTIAARASEAGHLFGRVTDKVLADAIRKAGGPVLDKDSIAPHAPIKDLGEHLVTVDLLGDVVARVPVTVVASD